jgi:hypothetical protein
MTAAANWYPDPQNPAQLRWWDGMQWTPHTHPLFAPPTAGQSAYVTAFPPTASLRDPYTGLWISSSTMLLRHNRLGFAGVALAIGSLIINPVCGVSVAAIVFCGIGLSNDARLRAAGQTRTGRGWLIAGLTISIVSTLFWAFLYLLRLYLP